MQSLEWALMIYLMGHVQELVQRKGLDLLRFLGKLQSEAKQPLQLDSSTSCGQCLACLQPALLVPCLVKVRWPNLLPPCCGVSMLSAVIYGWPACHRCLISASPVLSGLESISLQNHCPEP